MQYICRQLFSWVFINADKGFLQSIQADCQEVDRELHSTAAPINVKIIFH